MFKVKEVFRDSFQKSCREEFGNRSCSRRSLNGASRNYQKTCKYQKTENPFYNQLPRRIDFNINIRGHFEGIIINFKFLQTILCII